jgi:non-homologous end joining protein Ku
MKALAPEPTRSTSTAVIALGLITIPVSLYTSTQATGISRKEFTKAGNAVGRKQFDKETGDDVDPSDIIKKAVASDGKTWVEVNDDEIAAATVTTDTAKVEALLSTGELFADYHADKLYQIRPKVEKKGGAAAERAFALLMQSLAKRDEAAIIRLPMRGNVARVAAITGDGYLRILSFTDGIRNERTMPEVELLPSELDLADKLLDGIGYEMPDMHDVTAEQVQRFVDAKAAGVAPTAAPTPIAAPAGDLAELLALSLAASE